MYASSVIVSWKCLIFSSAVYSCCSNSVTPLRQLAGCEQNGPVASFWFPSMWVTSCDVLLASISRGVLWLSDILLSLLSTPCRPSVVKKKV